MKTRRSQQKTRREKRRLRKKIFIAIISSITIIITGLYILHHPYLRLGNIEIQGQRTLIRSDLQQVVTEKLDQDILGFIPRDNIFVFNQNSLEKFLLYRFPKIDDITVSVDQAENIIITIGERTAHSLWCINRIYESPFDEECYFADDQGLLYARAPYFSGNIFLKLFILPDEAIENYIGMSVRESADFSEFFGFIDRLETELFIAINSIYFDEFNDVRIILDRLDATVFENDDVTLYYNQLDEYEIILRNISLILGVKEFRDEFRIRPQRLESIDVRFDGRIFYTFTPNTIDSDSE